MNDINPNMSFNRKGISRTQQEMGAVKEISHFIRPYGRVFKNLPGNAPVDQGENFRDHKPCHKFSRPVAYRINGSWDR